MNRAIITFLILLTALFANTTTAQVAINANGTPPNSSAMLDVQSNSKGLLVPRMLRSERNQISQPATGLLIWQTDNTPGYYFNEGTPSSPNWQLLGATGPQGVPGQPGVLQTYHLYGSAGRSGVASTVAALQPGLTQTFTLAAPARIVVWASIGARATVPTVGAYANVDMIIYLNGTFLANGGWNRFQVANAAAASSINACAINTSFTLPAGTHTLELRTTRSAGTTTVDIGGNSSADINPGEMTIMVLNQ